MRASRPSSLGFETTQGQGFRQKIPAPGRRRLFSPKVKAHCRFSSTVPSYMKGFCGTVPDPAAQHERIEGRRYPARRAECARRWDPPSRLISRTRVLFPPPEGPTITDSFPARHRRRDPQENLLLPAVAVWRTFRTFFDLPTSPPPLRELPFLPAAQPAEHAFHVLPDLPLTQADCAAERRDERWA